MSTKTLRKRIALVAVSAMGFGLLSTGVAHADDSNAASGDITYAKTASLDCFTGTLASGAQAIGVLSGSSVTGTRAVGNTMLASTRYIVVTGAASISSYTAGTATVTPSDDRKSLKIVGTDGQTLPTAVVVKPSTTGTFNILYKNSAGTVLDNISVYVTTSCGDYSKVSVADSASSLQTNDGTAFTADTATSTDLSSASLIANRGTIAIKNWLVDKYGNAVDQTSSSYLGASATGGATIDWNATSSTKTSAILAGTGANLKAAMLEITCPDSDNPSTSTVSATYNGVEFVKKTIKCAGDVASIKVTAQTNNLDNVAASTNAISYQVFDSAGNALRSKKATLYVAGATGSLEGVTDADGTAATTGATDGSKGQRTLTVNNLVGKGTAKLRILKSDGVTYVYSDVLNFLASKGGAVTDVNTYTLSLDKSSYDIGSIITVTIKAFDSNGLAVADGTPLASATAKLDMAVTGATAVTTPAITDTSVDGAWVYKYTAGTTSGNWVASVGLKDNTDTAKQVTYSINSAGGVSNTEVLAAIVKLIASINKQIAALQKALMKK